MSLVYIAVVQHGDQDNLQRTYNSRVIRRVHYHGGGKVWQWAVTATGVANWELAAHNLNHKQETEQSEMAQVLKLSKSTLNDLLLLARHISVSAQTGLPIEDYVFKCLGIWGTIHSNYHLLNFSMLVYSYRKVQKFFWIMYNFYYVLYF